jgi:hypothetical protein
MTLQGPPRREQLFTSRTILDDADIRSKILQNVNPIGVSPCRIMYQIHFLLPGQGGGARYYAVTKWAFESDCGLWTKPGDRVVE